MVKRIEMSGNLDDEDRQRLLKAHEDALNGVEQMMGDDRKRQQMEMDRALKERMEKRRQRKRKENKNDLKEDVDEMVGEVNEMFDGHRKEALEEMEKDHRAK
jgi:hypothetical protein